MHLEKHFGVCTRKPKRREANTRPRAFHFIIIIFTSYPIQKSTAGQADGRVSLFAYGVRSIRTTREQRANNARTTREQRANNARTPYEHRTDTVRTTREHRTDTVRTPYEHRTNTVRTTEIRLRQLNFPAYDVFVPTSDDIRLSAAARRKKMFTSQQVPGHPDYFVMLQCSMSQLCVELKKIESWASSSSGN